MTSERVEQFANDYQNTYGENLDNVLSALPKPMPLVAFVNRVETLIDTLLGGFPAYRKDRLTDSQRQEIYIAQLEQAYYMVSTEDYSIISGIDFANAGVIPDNEIEKKLYSKIAKRILKNAGLMYRGIINDVNSVDRFDF